MLYRLNSFVPLCVTGIFLALLVAGMAEGSTPVGSALPRAVAVASLSPVILAERPEAVQEFTVDSQQARQMLNRALLTLTSASDIGTAWKRLGITPGDIVGIKITTDGGPALSTHRPLVQAICDGLRAAGVPSYQIIVWDRLQRSMTAAGYAPQTASNGLPTIASIFPGNNYDPDVFYRVGIIGNLIWGDSQFNKSLNPFNDDSDQVLTKSYYTKFLTQICTKIVNVPVLNFNEQFGIDACLSNLALGSVDNNRRFLGAPYYGDPWIDEIYDQSFIRRKVVVQILDALVAQCAGGPAFNPLFCQSFGALYVSRDPVAIDSLVLPRIERMRQAMGVPPVGRTASHIKDAPSYGLGTTDHRRIQLVRVP